MPCSCCSHEVTSKICEPFIDRLALLHNCPLDNGAKKFKTPALGPESEDWKSSRLQFLPVELYQACLQYLDLATLTAMRRVSQYTRQAIDTLYQYQELYEHAPQALRACLSTGVAPHIPLLRLHDALTSMECYYCATNPDFVYEFGSYLSLYEGRRVCLFCIRNHPVLKPVELKTLISLRCQRSSSIRDISQIPLLNSLPGFYGLPTNSTPRIPRTILARAYAVARPNTVLNDKESHALFGNTRTAVTSHHPFVSCEDESSIWTNEAYIAPETVNEIKYTYMSVIAFPYLVSSRTVSDYGVLCVECNWKMRWEEHRWKEEQAVRRRNGQRTTASMMTRDRINAARERACKMYCVSEEASADDAGMSIREHRAVHAEENVSREEMEWRESTKRPPLPLFGHDRFG